MIIIHYYDTVGNKIVSHRFDNTEKDPFDQKIIIAGVLGRNSGCI